MPWMSSQGTVSGMRLRGSGCSSRMTKCISGGSPRLPVRPMRCRKLETVKGAFSWKARSRRPMSIPSSSVAVVTVVSRRSGSRMSSSAISRKLEEILPWWMRKRSGSWLASQYPRSAEQTASASSRELQKTRHFAPRVRSKM